MEVMGAGSDYVLEGPSKETAADLLFHTSVRGVCVLAAPQDLKDPERGSDRRLNAVVQL